MVMKPGRLHGDAGRHLAEQLDLGVREGPMLARRKALEHDGANGDPGEAHDLVPELGEHPADLAL
ncbi:MAG: hypothetical protein ACP5XB_03025, partial [Isosphaeraceae bacterium]